MKDLEKNARVLLFGLKTGGKKSWKKLKYDNMKLYYCSQDNSCYMFTCVIVHMFCVTNTGFNRVLPWRK